MSGFAGIPTVMAALAAPYALNEFVAKPGFGIYSGVRGIIDDVNKRQDQELLNQNLKKAQDAPDTFVHDYTGYNNPAEALEYDKHIDYVIKRALERGDLPLLNEIARREAAGNYDMTGLVPTNTMGQAALDKFQKAGRDRATYTDFITGAQNVSPAAMADFALSNPDKLDALRKIAENVSSAKEKVILAQGMAEIEAKDSRGEYKNIGQKMSDISTLMKQAPNATNNFLTEFTTNKNSNIDQWKNEYGPMTSQGVGRTSSIGQYNKMGDFKKDVQSVAPVINIGVGRATGTDATDPGFQFFWTQQNKNAPPMLERVPIGSNAYGRYMYGDLSTTGSVVPFGRKGQMTSNQALKAFQYNPNNVVTVNKDGNGNVTSKQLRRTVPKQTSGNTNSNQKTVSVVRDANGKLVIK